MVAIWERLVLGTIDVGVENFKEIARGYLGLGASLLDSCLEIDRLNSDQDILLMHIIYRNCNVFNQTSEVVGFHGANCRLNVLVYGGRGIRDREDDVLEYLFDTLHHLCG